MVEAASILNVANELDEIQLIRFVKAGQGGAVDIQNANDFSSFMKRNHDLGIRGAVAGDMSRELVDILYQHNLIVCHSGSADTFTDFNFNTGRFALERTKDEPAFSHQIKTNPVDIQKRITEKGRCICQI